MGHRVVQFDFLKPNILLGSYSQSTGVEVVREDIAAYIEQRDGIPSSPENVFLASGASEAVKVCRL